VAQVAKVGELETALAIFASVGSRAGS